MMMPADAEKQAAAFAIGAHSAIGQTRKYTGEPYWHHPQAVAGIVWHATDSYVATAAAWLHDVLEDTNVTRDTLLEIFDPEIVDLVFWVTDVSRLEDGNRRTRKEIDLAHLSHAPALAQSIKVADLIDNTSTIVKYDPAFAKVYMQEMRELLEVLTLADESLLASAWNILKSYEANFNDR